MRHERASAISTITAEIEQKREELKRAEEAFRRAQLLRQEIHTLEQARAVLGGQYPNQIEGSHRGGAAVPASGSLSFVTTGAKSKVSTESSDLFKRPESLPQMVFKVLKEAGKPLAADEIMAALLMRDNSISRPSVLGSIYRVIKSRKMFYIVKPGVFGLLEWQKNEQEAR